MIQYSMGANFVLFVTNWLWESGEMGVQTLHTTLLFPVR